MSRTIDRKEFGKGCKDYGIMLTRQEVDEVYGEMDRDGSGTIDFDEFLLKLRPAMSKSRLRLIHDAFVKVIFWSQTFFNR